MFIFSTACPSGTKRATHLTRLRGEAEPSAARVALGRFASFVVLLVLSLLLAPSATQAQVLYGSLVGHVTDPNGAAVPGAKVEVVNVSTQAAKSTTTDEDGGYSVTDLAPGVYNVTVTAASFKTALREAIRIDANMVRRVDAQLQVGEVKETVVISAATEVP